MNKYDIWRKEAQKKFNDFPVGFTFNKKQLAEGMEKLGVKTKDELVSIGYGGFIRKKDKQAYVDLIKWIDDS